MGKERLIKDESDEICIKEPIIMRFLNNMEIKNLFLDKHDLYIDGDYLIVENPSNELVDYCDKWMKLITDVCTGSSTYPELFNIESNVPYEYMVITTKYNARYIRCLPTTYLSNGHNENTVVFYIHDQKNKL